MEDKYQVLLESIHSKVVRDFKAKTDRLFHSEAFGGMTPKYIEENVKSHIDDLIFVYDYCAEIADVVIVGSRSRGLERVDSDLDVVITYYDANRGCEREDDMYDLVHDEPWSICGIEVDVNPRCLFKSGYLADYLPLVEKYLSEKTAPPYPYNEYYLKNITHENCTYRRGPDTMLVSDGDFFHIRYFGYQEGYAQCKKISALYYKENLSPFEISAKLNLPLQNVEDFLDADK